MVTRKKQKKLRDLLAKLENFKTSGKRTHPDLDEKIELLKKRLQKIDKMVAKETPDTVAKPKKLQKKAPAATAVAVEAEAQEEKMELREAEEADLPGTSQLIQEGLFSELQLSEATRAGIRALNFDRMTPVQRRAIPPLLDNKDVMGCAKTGSGKTLAFLIPALERMHRLRFRAEEGTGVIVISPTRELSLQTYGVLQDLAKEHKFRTGIVMGGADRKTEAKELAKGVTLLVATPGRLLDHLQNTNSFLTRNLKCLIIDEADRILDVGFELEMQQILRLLPATRQTMFFSATLTAKTRALASKAVKKGCVHIEIDAQAPDQLQQGFILCEPKRRFDVLYNFLRRNKDKKIMVFMSACLEVKYYYELLNYIDVPVMAIHGRQKQSKRSTTFFQFCKAPSATLLCTDVAARGLDIPEVHWIVQFDPPADPKEYVHRVGRTARAGATGQALLILRPHEVGFLRELHQAGIQTAEFDVKWSKVADVQDQLEKLLDKSFYLARSAHDGYKSYIRAYASHKLKDHFNVERLDLTVAANNFGLKVAPLVDLKSFVNSDHRRRDNKKFENRKRNDKTKMYRKKK